MMQKVDVVAFDFDGTLSAGESSIEFVKYCMARNPHTWLYLPLMAVAGVVRWVRPAGLWWRHAMRRFMTADMVKKYAPEFVKKYKMERFGWAAERVAAERAAGRKVLLISAGPDYLIEPLTRDMKFDAVLCSRMDAARPWKIDFLCWGPAKVVAMDEWARKHKYIPRLVRAYSDSRSDLPMMEIADEQVWIDKKTGLRKQTW